MFFTSENEFNSVYAAKLGLTHIDFFLKVMYNRKKCMVVCFYGKNSCGG